MNNIVYGIDMDRDYAELIRNENDDKKRYLLLLERRFKLRCSCVREALRPGDYLYDHNGVKYILQEIVEGGYGDKVYKAVYYNGKKEFDVSEVAVELKNPPVISYPFDPDPRGYFAKNREIGHFVDESEWFLVLGLIDKLREEVE